MKFRHANRGSRQPEALVPVDRGDRAALRAGENVAVGAGLGVGVEMVRHFVDEELGQGGPAGRVVLGGGGDGTVVAVLLPDLRADARVEEVDVAAPAGADSPLRDPGPKAISRSSARYLGSIASASSNTTSASMSGRSALRSTPPALDVARVHGQEAVPDGGVEDGAHQPVCLSRLERRDLIGDPSVPAPHLVGLDRRQLGRTERRQDLTVENVA